MKIFIVTFCLLLLLSSAACQSISSISDTQESTSASPVADTSVSTPAATAPGLESQQPEAMAESNTAEPGSTYEFTEKDRSDIEALIHELTAYAAAKDFVSIQGLFAIDEYINGYNTKLIAEGLNFSSDDERIQPPTSAERVNEVMGWISKFYFGFYAQDMDLDTVTQEDIFSSFNALNSNSLTVLRIDEPPICESSDEQEQMKNIMSKRACRYGAEAFAQRIMLFELNGKTYFCDASLIKYEGVWKIFDFSDVLFSITPSYAATYPMETSDYEALFE